MTAVTREDIMTALCARVFAVSSFKTTGRRVLHWSKVEQQPACFVRNVKETVERPNIVFAKRTMHAEIWIYFQAGSNKEAEPGAELNRLAEALDAAFEPDDGGLGTLTLGGLVQHCWIEGEVDIDPGDYDGQAKLVVPVLILVP